MPTTYAFFLLPFFPLDNRLFLPTAMLTGCDGLQAGCYEDVCELYLQRAISAAAIMDGVWKKHHGV